MYNQNQRVFFFHALVRELNKAFVHKDVCLRLLKTGKQQQNIWKQLNVKKKKCFTNYSISTQELIGSHITSCLGENTKIPFLAFQIGKGFLRRLIITIVGKGAGILTFLCTLGGNINWWNLFEQPFGSINLKDIHSL